jgi:hypothetical protein
MKKYLIFSGLFLVNALMLYLLLSPTEEVPPQAQVPAQRQVSEREGETPDSPIREATDALAKTPQGAPSVFDFALNETRSYAFSLRATGWANPAQVISLPGGASASGKQDFDMQMSGQLHLKVYPREEGQATYFMAMQFSNLSLQQKGATPEDPTLLESPFTAEIDPQGHLKQLNFPRYFPKTAMNQIKSLLSYFQVELNEHSGSGKWIVNVQFGRQSYTNRYEAFPGAAPETLILKRTKLDMRDAEMNQGLKQSVEILVGSSNASITLPESGDFPTRIRGQESLAYFANSVKWSEVQSQYEFKQLEAPTLELPDQLDEQLAAIKQVELPPPSQMRNQELDDLTRGLDMPALVKLYQSFMTDPDSNKQLIARKMIINHLRMVPEAAFTLVDYLNSRLAFQTLERPTRLSLWFYLAKAGTLESKQALTQAISSDNYTALTRWRAMQNVFQVEQPENFMVDAVWDTHQALEGATDQQSQELRNSALLGVGAFGFRSHDEQLRENVQEKLITKLQSTQDPRELVLALDSIGNFSENKMIPAIRPYFSAEDRKVRSAAFSALRNLPSAEAFQVFQQHYDLESDPMVKNEALGTLARMPPTENRVKWARREVMVNEQLDGQVALVKLLGETMETFPENEDTLRTLVASRQLDNRVKRRIYHHIVPK